jgi:hypothetical protein
MEDFAVRTIGIVREDAMAMSRNAAGLAALALAAGTAAAQESPYRVGEKVELMISAGHWQRCTVVDPGSSESVMRMRCDPYSSPAKSRAGGIYVESYDSSGVRRIAPTGRSAGATAARAAAQSQAAPGASGYSVGQAVELEASGHWVPCTVSETDPILRVRCTAYPALSRAAGEYIVHNEVTGLRPATGRTGPAAPAPAAAPPRRAAAPAGTLRKGEYACYGSGGQIMAGLAFKVTGPGRYTDLDGATSGSFSVSGSTVTFRGGHLGGQTGRELTANGFRIGMQATCEFWG